MPHRHDPRDHGGVLRSADTLARLEDVTARLEEVVRKGEKIIESEERDRAEWRGIERRIEQVEPAPQRRAEDD